MFLTLESHGNKQNKKLCGKPVKNCLRKTLSPAPFLRFIFAVPNGKLTVIIMEAHHPEKSIVKRYRRDNLIVDINDNLKFIRIKGYSVEESIDRSYSQILSVVKKFTEKQSSLILSFDYEWFNTTTIKYLLSIIKYMNRAHTQGKTMKIFWKANEERTDELTEAAIDLGMMCNFEFKIFTTSSAFDIRNLSDSKIIEHRKLLFGVNRSKARVAA